MKNAVKTIICLAMCICLCACSTQSTMDIFQLCKNFNTLADEDVLSTDGFLKEEKDNSYHCMLLINEKTTAALCAFADENNCIYKLSLTLVPEGTDISASEDILDFCVRFFLSFERTDAETVKERLGGVAFNAETKLFSDFHNEKQYEKMLYTAHSNNAGITVVIEAKP